MLVATGRTVEEINEIIGADTLGYLSVEHVQQLAPNSSCGFCTGCFTGSWPIPEPAEKMSDRFSVPLSQSDSNKVL